MAQAPPSSASTNSSSTARKSQAELSSWAKRVQEVQSTRMTPEVLSRIRENADRTHRAEESVRVCKRMEKVNYLQSNSSVSAFRCMEAPPAGGFGFAGFGAGAGAGGGSFKIAADSESVRSSALRHVAAKKSRAAIPMPSSYEERCAVVAASKAEEEEDEEQLGTVERDLVATTDGFVQFGAVDLAGGSAAVAVQQAAVADELTTLLQQLATEPKVESEVAAKFALYENLQETVAVVRTSTMEFWTENADQFVGASRASAQRDITAIDSGEAMGIQDDPRKWFVYLMAVKANKNSTTISRTLAQLRTRLELLAQAGGECPCCLEELTPAATVLGCCHKMCAECWSNWAELKGAAAFCPLCKHHEFVAEVFAAGV